MQSSDCGTEGCARLETAAKMSDVQSVTEIDVALERSSWEAIERTERVRILRTRREFCSGLCGIEASLNRF